MVGVHRSLCCFVVLFCMRSTGPSETPPNWICYPWRDFFVFKLAPRIFYLILSCSGDGMAISTPVMLPAISCSIFGCGKRDRFFLFCICRLGSSVFPRYVDENALPTPREFSMKFTN